MNPATLDPETTWTVIQPGIYMGAGDGYTVLIDGARWEMLVNIREYRGKEPTDADAVTEARDVRRLVMGAPSNNQGDA